MPLQATSGAASYDAFGGGAPIIPAYIEECFSCTLYTGTGSAQTITNGINLSANRGLVWIKGQDVVSNHTWGDTVRGTGSYIYSNSTQAADTGVTSFITAFNTTGFSLGSGSGVNQSTKLWTSWTFREQPKFFTVKTVTHNFGTDTTVDLSSLGTLGMVVIKNTTDTSTWPVWHRSQTNGKLTYLNATDAETADTSVSVSGTTLTISSGKASGTYVVYAWAHNAGGFFPTGIDNAISCGSLVSTGGVVNVNLGFETQWLLIKNASNIDSWYMYDTMRGMSITDDYFLQANNSNAESNFGASYVKPTATGFSFDSSAFGASGETYIYIAIRKGPMKVPTDATKVFSPIARNGTGAIATVTTTNRPDSIWSMNRSGATGYPAFFYDRLRGINRFLINNTGDEVYDAANSTRFSVTAFNNLNYTLGPDQNYTGINGLTSGYVNWVISRAPSFFDMVCYTGNSVTPRTITHNLTVAPELIFVKSRSNTRGWAVYANGIGAGKYLIFNGTNAALTDTTIWANTAPTSSVFTVGDPFDVNNSSYTYVAYLFSTCLGVSKVGSYTGTGTTQTVNCGFTSGARFVMIKRTDSTGDWYVWDTARGIISGNDPYLLLNSSAAEVTNTDYIDTTSVGFEITSTAPSAVNANGGSFIFLAIA
jgi:hypothetical protein